MLRNLMTGAAGCALLLGLAAGPVAAQGGAPSFSFSTYLWATETTVTADTPRGRVSSTLSFSDAIEDLKFAFMGTMEARTGPWGFIGDFLYFNLESRGAAPGPLFDRAIVNTELTIFSGYGVYRIHEDATVALDVGVGLRVFSGDTDVTLRGDDIREEFGLNKTWIDPLIAARMRVAFDENWFGVLAADAGGTNTTSSYNLLATIGYQLNDNWVFAGGWRYMSARWETGFGRNRLELSGPILGATYRF